VTISEGTNQLVDLETSAIVEAVRGALDRPLERREAPELWDGATAARIATALEAADRGE
jgi:hypothetical protein